VSGLRCPLKALMRQQVEVEEALAGHTTIDNFGFPVLPSESSALVG
jgi:hypothetical protein